MSGAIGDIVKLIGPNGPLRMTFGKLGRKATGDFHVIIGVGIRHRRHFDQLRSLQAQHVLFFLRLRIGNHNHRAIAQRIGDQSQTDSCISRRALHNNAAGLELTLGNGMLHDG